MWIYVTVGISLDFAEKFLSGQKEINLNGETKHKDNSDGRWHLIQAAYQERQT